jgi:hypothetical protein
VKPKSTKKARYHAGHLAWECLPQRNLVSQAQRMTAQGVRRLIGETADPLPMLTQIKTAA